LGDIDVSSIALPNVRNKIDWITEHINSDNHRKLLRIWFLTFVHFLQIIPVEKLSFKELEEAFVLDQERPHIPTVIEGRHNLIKEINNNNANKHKVDRKPTD